MLLRRPAWRLGLLLPAIVALVAGCSAIDVEVTTYLSEAAFPAGEPAARVFVEAEVRDGPVLLAAEVRRLVQRELGTWQFSCVDQPGEADFVLAVSCGVDAGAVLTRAVPHSEATFYDSTVYGYCGRVHRTHGQAWSRTYTPESYRVFDRWLMMTLVDRPRFDAGGEAQRAQATVWQATAVSTSENRDLRAALRYLLTATFEHFGEDTGRTRRHTYLPGADQTDRFAPQGDEDGHGS